MQREDAITLSGTFAKMFKNTGFPRTVITDQGTNMMSKLFEDLHIKLGISHNYTTHYHTMANGEVERTHRTILSRLTTSMTESGEDWDKLSSFMVMGYNSTPHSAHEKSPHEVHFGKPPILPSQSPLSFITSQYAKNDNLNEQRKKMKEGWQMAHELIEAGQ